MCIAMKKCIEYYEEKKWNCSSDWSLDPNETEPPTGQTGFDKKFNISDKLSCIKYPVPALEKSFYSLSRFNSSSSFNSLERFAGQASSAKVWLMMYYGYEASLAKVHLSLWLITTKSAAIVDLFSWYGRTGLVCGRKYLEIIVI